MIKFIESKRKGQISVFYSDSAIERLHFNFHANTLIPVKDTLHFGIKPGHFMLYVKYHNKKGEWKVKDPGYINYFRKDQKNVEQTEYNTLSKQKLFSKGFLSSKIYNSKMIVTSTSLLPLHKRTLTVFFKERFIEVEDKFFGKADIYFNTSQGLITDTNWWSNIKILEF